MDPRNKMGEDERRNITNNEVRTDFNNILLYRQMYPEISRKDHQNK